MKTTAHFRRIALILFFIACANIVAYAWIEGYMGGGYSNGPNGEKNCTDCHNSYKLQKTKTRIQLSGISNNGYYIPGKIYHLELTYLFSTTGKGHAYGFQITAVDAKTHKTPGTFKITDKTGTVTQTASPGGFSRTYVGHLQPGASSGLLKTWKFDWTAPKAASANNLTFYCVLNSANNNYGSDKDTIFADTFAYKPAPALVAGYSKSGSICLNSMVTYDDTTHNDTSRIWTFTDGSNVTTSTFKNPSYTFTSTTNDSISLTVYDSFGQKTTIRQAITVKSPAGMVKISAAKDTICYGDSLNISSAGYKNYLWNNGKTDSSIFVKDSGNYVLNVMDSLGCNTASSPFHLSISRVSVIFGFTDSAFTYNFADSTAGAMKWLWDFGDSSLDSLASPMHTYKSSGTYKTLLTVYNHLGCMDTVSHAITIAKVVTGTAPGSRPVIEGYIFPNPANELFTLRFTSDVKSMAHAEVTDMIGRTVLTENIAVIAGNNSHQFSVKGLPNGKYILHLQTSEGVLNFVFLKL